MQESNTAEQSGNKEPRYPFEPFQGREQKYSSTSWEGIRIGKSGGKMIQCLSLSTLSMIGSISFLPSSLLSSHTQRLRDSASSYQHLQDWKQSPLSLHPPSHPLSFLLPPSVWKLNPPIGRIITTEILLEPHHKVICPIHLLTVCSWVRS